MNREPIIFAWNDDEVARLERERDEAWQWFGPFTTIGLAIIGAALLTWILH
jgi:hypothetical protein